LREDVRIPGLRNTDAADLALKRPVRVSSHAKLDLGGVDEKRSYNLGAARREGVMTSEAISMVVPLTSDRLDAVEFYLRNELPKDQRLIVNLQRLERIWDRDDNQVLATAEVVVPASSTGWVKADLKAAIVPGHPYRISIRGGESVSSGSPRPNGPPAPRSNTCMCRRAAPRPRTPIARVTVWRKC
jgi:hypothetical protein